MFYRRKKHKTLIFLCKVVDDNSAVFFQAKKIRKKYCVEKKNYYTILNAFFLRGQKLDSLVWYDLGGPTNYVKIRISVVE